MADETQYASSSHQSHEHTPNVSDSHQSVFSEFKKPIFWFCVAIIFITLLIFIFLPTLFALLGVFWPKIFSGTSALQQLTNNLNSLVGYVSMIVGIGSIVYAYISNQSMKMQSQNQQQFLDALREENEQILSTVHQIYTSNQQFFKQFDRFDNLKYSSLNTPESANEQ